MARLLLFLLLFFWYSIEDQKAKWQGHFGVDLRVVPRFETSVLVVGLVFAAGIRVGCFVGVGVGGKSEVRNRAPFGSWCRTQATTHGGNFAERSFPSFVVPLFRVKSQWPIGGWLAGGTSPSVGLLVWC